MTSNLLDLVAQFDAAEQGQLNPLCHTRLLTHGHKTERVVVLLHGYTNCPAQYRELAHRLYVRGQNVLVPRLPFHGYRDRLTDTQGRLTGQQLITVLDAALDAACELGRQVVVAGISMSGTLAAWGAQHRNAIHRAVAFAPLFGVPFLPHPVAGLTARVWLALPNHFRWWSMQTRESGVGPSYAYPRFATHVIAETLLLAQEIRHLADRLPPVAPHIVIVTAPGDRAVNMRATTKIVQLWQAHGADVQLITLPASLGLVHDFIDPFRLPGDLLNTVYTTLIQTIEGGDR